MHITTSQPLENRKRQGEHITLSLTYIGRNSDSNNGIGLARLLEQWRRNNEKSGVTSALVVNDNYFIQNIEGPRPLINEILVKLISEYSYLVPHLSEIEEIEERRWDGFLIKYLTSSAEDEEYTLKSFSAGADFNPYLMNSTQITSFLKVIFEYAVSNKS
ncbi:BLUF domain-containing protein [Psychrobacter sp. 28M-43]|uniref:BLUF domain-containing protein n=1 Tax=Psychrobacter sp. 28M-43 TaxID=2772254 RepID=UPI00168D9A6A|nr:BLUF domain-containing protein [Psychrobacter sp. 28M-43]QOD12463.1 BLUF domain-containing protein [Psychrobacter sp. 28M-43]